MGSLTTNTPKPLLEIKGKTLLQRTIEKLPDSIDEVILVVGFGETKIREFFGDTFFSKKITYIKQEELLGTGHALWLAKEYLRDTFLVLMADDIYEEKSIKEILLCDFAMLVYPTDWISGRGDIVLDENNALQNIVFYNTNPKHKIRINTGMYVLSTNIFNHKLVKHPKTNEYSLPHTLLDISKSLPMKIIETDSWFQINTPEDFQTAKIIL